MVAIEPSRQSSGSAEIWVPVTLHLPLGFAKQWTPDSCIPASVLCGPFTIIFLAQTANTVLVPVLPFLVKDVGANAVAYGGLQSILWTSQTVLAPLLGYLSDKIGRRPVIILSLLISALGNALLALAYSIQLMAAARIISGLGFQIALFRAYFADVAPKGNRASKFGLIGVIQGFSLFGGPALGGFVSKVFGRRSGAWLSAVLCMLGAVVASCWNPGQEAEDRATRVTHENDESHKTTGGVTMVKIDLADTIRESHITSTSTSIVSSVCDGYVCRCLRKTWYFAVWIAKVDLYPLLSLNFFFRLAFAAYKSSFAFFCAAAFNFGAQEVGLVLSGMGIAGMLVQGMLVRLMVSSLGEERTLLCAMVATSLGLVLLSYAWNLILLIPSLLLIAIGYGLAVPCLSALFANVPVEQGVMQGFAGAIDRFGQAFGPLMSGSLLTLLGEASMMRSTGVSLAMVSGVCLLFIGDGCISWIRQALLRSSGYAAVATAEEHDVLGESTALLPEHTSKVNEGPRTGLDVPIPARLGHGSSPLPARPQG